MKMQKGLSADARRRPQVAKPVATITDVHVIQSVILLLKETGQSSLLLTALSKVENGCWSEYSDLTIDPRSYDDASNFSRDYLALEILSKYPFENEGTDRASVSLAKFVDSELQCASSNSRLWRSTREQVFPAMWPAVEHTARRKIERVLGPFRQEEAEAMSSFGPGATTSLRRSRGDTYYKFGHSKPDTTHENATLAWVYVYNIPRWFEHLTGALPTDVEADFLAFPPEKVFNVVGGNRVTTVPKNYKTDRTIGIEPDLNMFVQKGIGTMIRHRLRRVGVDLDDQTHNQRLARVGSVDGSLATIDLSSASDTISIAIVELLLPPDWYTALKQCRCAKGVLPDGSEVVYRKFSSMGNGFTFELESLIFWALCSAVSEVSGIDGVISVYGDDIIVPTKVYPAVETILSFAGFTTNKKKTFADGPFRESCGKHYFKGCDVTPLYLRDRPTLWSDYVAYANKLRRHARLSWGLDSSYRPAYDYVVSQIPSYFRNYIPDSLGDLGLVADWDEACPVFDRKHMNYYCYILLAVSRPTAFEGYPYLLRQLLSKERNGEEVLHAPVKLLPGKQGLHPPVRKKQKTVMQWESFGPWLTDHPVMDN